MSARPRLPESRPEDVAPLSEAARAEIAREVAKYPAKHPESAVMAALRIAQKERGWLSRETIEGVAGHLGIPAIRALEVATFYNMYDLRPVGRWKLCVCTNLPCALRGAEETAEALKAALGVGFGGTTADGEFTLTEGRMLRLLRHGAGGDSEQRANAGPPPPRKNQGAFGGAAKRKKRTGSSVQDSRHSRNGGSCQRQSGRGITRAPVSSCRSRPCRSGVEPPTGKLHPRGGIGE